MLILYFLYLKSPFLLVIPYILRVVPYYFVLNRMGLNRNWAFIPCLAEYQLTTKLFPKKRTFFRPFIVACMFIGFSLYLSPFTALGLLYNVNAFIIYGIFLMRLYTKMAKAFSKKWYFMCGIYLIPAIFIMILAFNKSEYEQPEFKISKESTRFWKYAKRVAFVTLSVVEFVAIFLFTGFVTIRQQLPRFLVEAINQDVYDATVDVKNSGKIITREKLLGTRVDDVVEDNTNREYYFQDHSNDKTVNVFVYMVGADLEFGTGFASVNLRQMMDATTQGTGIKFVLEIGGSKRWFTKGIEDGSYGRYEVYDGKLTKVEDLPRTTNMASKEELTNFLKWGKDNYAADRNMLVLWDHGGGLTGGYAYDDINGQKTISVTDMIDAFKTSQTQFDLIGFDACLMQDIEIVNAFEPYADYFLASEETESGYGWYYTYAFGELSKNPGMSTVDFGKEIISCFDAYNYATSKNEDSSSTLSLVDLTLVKSAYTKLDNLFDMAADKILVNKQAFANISIAGKNTYDFSNYQVDLIGFLQILDDLDYNDEICSHEQKQEIIDTLLSTVVCRNANSSKGINGMAFAFPYNDLSFYDNISDEFKILEFANEKRFIDEVFSIINSQQLKADKDAKRELDTSDLMSILTYYKGPDDYSGHDWYIQGFEDYDDTPSFIDIPLIEQENGYTVDLPDKTWDIITDVQTMVYQKVDDPDAYIRYIGNDYIGDVDKNGHTTVSADEYWVHMNGQIVCYEANQVKVTDEGDIYTGNIPARLNNEEDITIVVEWDKNSESAQVLGYSKDHSEYNLEEKGYNQFVAGDIIQFLFDYYDENGNYIETRTDGKRIHVTKQERLRVVDQKMDPCTIQYGGIVKDIYQRSMTTEMIEYTVK